MSLSKIRLDRERSAGAGDRFLKATHRPKNIAQIIMNLGVVWLNLQRPAIAVYRFLEVPEICEYDANVRICSIRLWFRGECSFLQGEGFLKSSLSPPNYAEQMQSIKIFVLLLQYHRANLRGIFQPTHLIKVGGVSHRRWQILVHPMVAKAATRSRVKLGYLRSAHHDNHEMLQMRAAGRRLSGNALWIGEFCQA